MGSRETLKNPSASWETLRAALADVLLVIDGTDARAAILESDLSQVQEALE